MKTFRAVLSLLILLTPLISCSSNEIKGEFFTYENVNYTKHIYERINNEKYDYQIEVDGPSKKLRNDFAYGVDISTIEQVLECGGTFYNHKGQEQNVYEILKENGVNFIRLRLWNDPFNESKKDYGAGHNNLETDLKIMKEAKRVGMNILLDFHYSDFWADPGKQTMPKEWQNSPNIPNDVYDFTYDSLKYFKDNQIDIDAVQIGNEIDNGLIWPYAKVDYNNYDASLVKISNVIKKGIEATKKVYKDCETIIHLSNPNDDDSFIRYLDALKKNEVNYDILGVTDYPFWQGRPNDISNILNLACNRYDKPCMIIETSYAYTLEYHKNSNHIFGEKEAKLAGYNVSIKGQIEVLDNQIDMLSKIDNNHGLGIFYWEPCWLPVKGANAGNIYGQMYVEGRNDHTQYQEWENGWANQALFSFEGRMLPSLKTYLEIQKINESLK